MTSRLSSLLVRDGLVSVRRMERAFQRQVIYGGTLDTILLEMNLVPEDRLVQYLSLSTGIPPAQSQEIEVFDAEAVKKCPADVADKFRVAPLTFADGTLRVLVHDPVDLSLLEELADELDVAVQPLVTPEYRFHQVSDRLYDREGNARFAKLAEKAQSSVRETPVGKSKTVIVESAERRERREQGERAQAEAAGAASAAARKEAPAKPAPLRPEIEKDHVVVDVPLPPSQPARATMEFSTEALKRHQAETEREAAARKSAAAESVDTAVPEVVEPDKTVPSERPEGMVEEREAEAPEERQAEAPEERQVEAPEERQVEAPEERQAEAPEERQAEAPPAVSALSAADARRALEEADDRDATFNVLLRALRARTSYAALVTVQGGAAIGRVALAGDGVLDRRGIGSVLIPLDADSAFRRAVDTQSPHIGVIATGDPEIDGMIERMGGVVPPSALILPVVLRNRVVAMAVAHRHEEPISVADVAEVLPLAHAAAQAIERLIVKAKAGARQAAQAVPEPAEEERTNQVQTPGSGAANAAQPESPTSPGGEPAPAGMAEILDRVENGDDDASTAAMLEALDRPGEALAQISERFPGRLLVKRDDIGDRVLRAADHGRLLSLVVELGEASADLLAAKMQDPQSDLRYFATLCAGEILKGVAADALAQRLFDPDAQVRARALDALSRTPVREQSRAIDVARQALRADDPERVRLASQAVAGLGEERAIPDLLDAHDRGQATEVVEEALRRLTAQDFGSSTRKWRNWFNKNQHKNRIEWLLESLGHKSADLRRTAIEELRSLCKQDFGYDPDSPKKEREQKRQRWNKWWQETGRKRFTREAVAERSRPTAVLPARRGEPRG